MDVIRDILPPGSEDKLRPPAELTRLEWIRHAGIEIDGRPFSLEKLPWQPALYRDDSRVKVFRKGSQIAQTIYSSMTVLHGADQRGQRWIYFLPTDTLRDEFVKERINTMIAGSKYLKSRIGDTDTPGLKKIGNSVVYFRGLYQEKNAKSIPADGICFDEVDEHKPELILTAQARVMASEWQFKMYLSVPSFTGYGIDKLFRESDQHYWVHKCPSCGRWNYLDRDFPANFLEIPSAARKSFPEGATHYRGCRYCRQALDIRQGEWVRTERSAVRGYHISRLYTLIKPPDHANVATFLMAEFAKAHESQENMRHWMIDYRGLPFDGKGARLNDDMLREFERGYGFFPGGHNCVMGVDQGNRIHVSIYVPVAAADLQLIYCEVTEDWDRVHHLFRQYGCYVGGVDANPNRHPARALAAAFKGRVFLQDFAGDQFEEDERSRRKRRRWNMDGRPEVRRRKITSELHKGKIPVPRFSADKLTSLDDTVDFVANGHLILPDRNKLSSDHQIAYEEFRYNLCNLKWKLEDTPSGQRQVYLRIDNHHGMGLNTARLVTFEIGKRMPSTGTAPVFISWGGNA